MTNSLKHIDFEPPGWTEFSSGPTLQQGYVNQVLADSPLAYWRLGESAGSSSVEDFSGNANHGTYIGNLTPGQPGALASDSDTSVSFPVGTSNYITTPLTLASTEPMSCEAWFKLDTANRGIISQEAGTGLGLKALRVTGGTLTVAMSFMPSTSLYSSFRATQGQWAHVVVTFSGGPSGTLIFYANGQNKGVRSYTNRTADGVFIIGAYPASTATFAGFIDEVAIYNTVLTASQILVHYNAGVGR